MDGSVSEHPVSETPQLDVDLPVPHNVGTMAFRTTEGDPPVSVR